MTQEKLAATARISVGSLRDLEQGRTRASRWETLEGLATVLGLGEAERAELILALQTGRVGDTAARRKRLRVPPPASRHPPMVRIDVFGVLAVSRDEVALQLGSARQRTVLGLLAVHAGADVHRDTIIDVLWGERPPSSAVNKVQGYVSRLRRMLGSRLGDGADADPGLPGRACRRDRLQAGAIDQAVSRSEPQE
jgi:transcriptional regulator with XRE-family HTH domain